MLHELYDFIKLVLKTVTKTKKGKDKKPQQPPRILIFPIWHYNTAEGNKSLNFELLLHLSSVCKAPCSCCSLASAAWED